MGCIFIVLILSTGSETRPLNPTVVRGHMLGNWTPLMQRIAEDRGGGAQRDKLRLSPGGPDPHHH